MRISDWSSDVCSSDLISRLRQRNQRLTWRMWAHALRRRNPAPGEQLRKLTSALVRAIGGASLKVDQCRREIPTRCLTSAIMEHFVPSPPSTASKPEERRVGKEFVRKCRYQGSRYH